MGFVVVARSVVFNGAQPRRTRRRELSVPDVVGLLVPISTSSPSASSYPSSSPSTPTSPSSSSPEHARTETNSSGKDGFQMQSKGENSKRCSRSKLY